MKILDLSAGNRAIWFDANHPDAVFCDIRPEVNPTFVCDTRALPAEVGSGYSLLVFDPPHVNFGANSRMSKNHGHHTTEEIRQIVKLTAREAHRVATEDALMAFKWNDHDQDFEKVLLLMSDFWEPLFGHSMSGAQARPRSETRWALLRKTSERKAKGREHAKKE